MALHVRRVAIVDSVASDLNAEVASLREIGRWTVIVARDADEIVKAAKESKIDVVLLGCGAPDSATIELAAQLRASATTAALPLILLAEGTARDLAEFAAAAGALGTIRKPAGALELPERVRELLGAQAGASPDVLFRGK